MTAALARRELGTTGLEVSALGFGGAGHRQPVSRAAPTTMRGAAVHESFAAGVRYFDTAPFYGFGLSELRLGTGAARRAATARDLHQGRAPARADRPAGRERRPRGLFLAAPVRAGVRLQLRRR